MTWFGKSIAILNILATGAFLWFAFQDYATREAWAYANYVHEVAVVGLPLDDKVTDDRESPAYYDLAEETKADWFGPSGGPVATQAEEVKHVKDQVDAKVNALNDDLLKQTAEMARILAPFAQHNDEREWLVGVRTYLATPEDSAKLNKRLHEAFTAAVQAYQARPDDLKFAVAFKDACTALGGVPAGAFEQSFVKLLPAKPEKTFADAVKDAQNAKVPMGATPEDEAHLRAVACLQNLRDDPKALLRTSRDDPAKTKDTLDDVYQQALVDVHDQLKAQLEGLFDEAQNGPKSLAEPTARLRDAQRRSIAHLLFNTVEALQDDAPDKGVFGAPGYTRFLRVVGLSMGVREINDQAWRLQKISEELQGTRQMERGAFAASHRVLIDELQARAEQLTYAIDQFERDKQKLADEDQIVMRRKDDVKQAEDKLAEARATTDKQLTELRKKSDSLHDKRIEGRDVLGENLELEKKIRELENNKH